MAAHLRKCFNPAFRDHKAHFNKYKHDFLECKETFKRWEFFGIYWDHFNVFYRLISSQILFLQLDITK